MTNQTQIVPFHGSGLIAVQSNDIVYTAVKPIVSAIGLDWGSQQRKLKAQMDKFNCSHMTIVAEDGKKREMLCMPLRKLNGWLFSINPSKVKPELKDKLIQYQEECFEALHDYWLTGKAEKKPATKKLTKAHRECIKDLVIGRANGLPKEQQAKTIITQWSTLKSHFGKSYKELDDDQFIDAVSLISRLPLEGEYIPNDAFSYQPFAIEDKKKLKMSKEELARLMWLWFAGEQMRDLLGKLREPLALLGATHAVTVRDHFIEYKRTMDKSREILLDLSNVITPHEEVDLGLKRVLPSMRANDINLNY